MLENLASEAEQTVDARPAARFTGEDRDPPPGVAPGHIPGSRSLPHGELFHAAGTRTQGDALQAAFAAADIDFAKPLVTTCARGLTAPVLAFGAPLPGQGAVAVSVG